MNKKHLLMAAVLLGAWYWHKRRGIATPTTAGTDTATNTSDAEGWMGAWGLSK